ncbi:MAG TPA: aldo/keto reductase [Microbacteriaceae bacterium]|jgi:aryl-alcohol dehydrogenase-like predicted oxidoreductase|nr:aldo/keto reductase [Microbacteriaceae bacterium]
MRYTLLGKSGIRVSQLCLGTMVFGEYYNHDWGSGLDKSASGRVLDAFADADGNFVDTADYYTGGASETFLGELMHGRRDRFVLATKYTMQTDTGDLNTAGSHRKNLAVSLERSLERLQTDYIDLFWVHAYDTLTPIQEVMRALDDQVRLGKVLHVGVSNWPAWEISAANTLSDLRGWSPYVATQIKYNLMERTPERELMPMARAYDLAVTAWSPLSGGLLTGKYLPGAGGEGTGRVVEYDERTERIAREVVAVADEVAATPSQVALAWLLGQPGTVIPIVGATSERQLEQNLACLELRLTAEQVARLAAVSAVDAGYPHDFLQVEHIKNIVYGLERDLVDDRRSG